MLQALDRLLPDPPPPLVFEIASGAVLGVRRDGPEILARAQRMLPLKPDGNAEGDLAAALEAILPDLAPLPGPQAAVLLPDDETRLAVFEFDRIPRRAQELRQAVEARFRNSLPFDARTARIAVQAQIGSRPHLVLAAAAARQQVRACEEAFERVGLAPQYVGLSSASALNLVQRSGMTLLLKLGDRAMTLGALDSGVVRLVRRIALPEGLGTDPEQALQSIVADLYPTLVYIEENLGRPAECVLVCGLGELTGAALASLPSELSCRVEPLLDNEGDHPFSEAGLRGYIHA